jgi:hypothetical protein
MEIDRDEWLYSPRSGPLPLDWLDREVRVYLQHDWVDQTGHLLFANPVGVGLRVTGDDIFVPWTVIHLVELV